MFTLLPVSYTHLYLLHDINTYCYLFRLYTINYNALTITKLPSEFVQSTYNAPVSTGDDKSLVHRYSHRFRSPPAREVNTILHHQLYTSHKVQRNIKTKNCGNVDNRKIILNSFVFCLQTNMKIKLKWINSNFYLSLNSLLITVMTLTICVCVWDVYKRQGEWRVPGKSC